MNPGNVGTKPQLKRKSTARIVSAPVHRTAFPFAGPPNHLVTLQCLDRNHIKAGWLVLQELTGRSIHADEQDATYLFLSFMAMSATRSNFTIFPNALQCSLAFRNTSSNLKTRQQRIRIKSQDCVRRKELLCDNRQINSVKQRFYHFLQYSHLISALMLANDTLERTHSHGCD